MFNKQIKKIYKKHTLILENYYEVVISCKHREMLYLALMTSRIFLHLYNFFLTHLLKSQSSILSPKKDPNSEFYSLKVDYQWTFIFWLSTQLILKLLSLIIQSMHLPSS